MNDEQQNDREHRKRAENFQVRIRDDEPMTDLYSSADSARGRQDGNVIHSYSDPRKAQQSRNTAQIPVSADRSWAAFRERNREKRKKNRRFFRLVWLVMILLVSLLVGQYCVSGIDDMLARGRGSVNVTVEIPKDATISQATSALNKAGVVQNISFFKLFAKLTKTPKNFDGGSYQLKTDMDYEELLDTIQSSKGRIDTVKITFREGVNAPEIAAALEKNGVCSAKEALAVINGNQLDANFDMLQQINNASKRYYKLEGYLFPDTYEFYKNEDPDQAVKKLVSDCNTKLTKQIRQKASDENLTVDQMLTLASMIQAEAADASDRYNVSSVFHNRLTSGKTDLRHLNSDPTTYYPYRQLTAVPAAIRSTYKSRYDTYTVEGLPPGPICSPGMDAINAALNPASTDYYYFCHDKKGKAYYAETNAQHQANLKKAGLLK